MSRHVHLLLPGLLPVPPDDAQGEAAVLDTRLPALETWLARADRGREAADPLCAGFARFGIEAPAECLPVAAVSHLADTGTLPPGPCLRADPVHLLPDRDQLVLFDSSSLGLSTAEAAELVTALNAAYADEGWHFTAPHAERWYLHLPAAPEVRCTPLPALQGQPIGRSLPAGEQGGAWRATLNEVQMLLYTQAVNTRREEAGEPTVSSLWFWGAGEAPTVDGERWAGVWSDEILERGLARLAGLTPQPAPPEAADWLSGLAAGRHLVRLDDLRRAAQTQGSAGWAQAVRDVEAEWAGPLLQALRSGHLASIILHADDGQTFTLGSGHLWRWWRRRRRLAMAV